MISPKKFLFVANGQFWDQKRCILIILDPLLEFFINFVQNEWGQCPMDTSPSIHHRLNVEISRGTFVKVLSILKGKSTWKLLHRFHVKLSTWI